MDFEGAPSSVPRRDLFHCANIWNFIWFPLNHIHHFLTLNPLTSRATLKLERGRAHHSRGPNSSPGYVACSVVLASRKPVKGYTVVPLRGGDRREDLPFERKTPGGCSDSAYRRPLDTEVENRHEGTLDVPKVISTAPTSS